MTLCFILRGLWFCTKREIHTHTQNAAKEKGEIEGEMGAGFVCELGCLAVRAWLLALALQIPSIPSMVCVPTARDKEEESWVVSGHNHRQHVVAILNSHPRFLQRRAEHVCMCMCLCLCMSACVCLCVRVCVCAFAIGFLHSSALCFARVCACVSFAC